MFDGIEQSRQHVRRDEGCINKFEPEPFTQAIDIPGRTIYAARKQSDYCLVYRKLKMKKLFIVLVVSTFAISASSVSFAKGRGGSSYYPGTGSKSKSTYVRGHVRKYGTYVPGHRRSTPDHRFEDNWTTKGNDNYYTGKRGSRVTEPGNR